MDNFSLDVLIKSIKDLRNMELARHLREALKTQEFGADSGLISELVEELENDIEEHIARLERIGAVLTPEERQSPEKLSHLRQQEVAWQAKCDLDEVQSLCEAFARAREIMGNLGAAERQNMDLRAMFGNLGSVLGLDAQSFKDNGDGMVFSPQFLQKLLQKGLAAQREAARKKQDRLDDLFDFDTPATPRNRLPKDWRSK